MILHLVWGLDEKEPHGKIPIISPKQTKLKVGLMEIIKRDYMSGEMYHWEGIWRRQWGAGHSEYRANVALVAFNSLHVGSLGQSCSHTQILFVLNLYEDEEGKR